MPNVHLTEQMAKYAQAQVDRGAYANLSEVVRAGMRMLMDHDGAQQFVALKADLDAAWAEVEAGKAEVFDPVAFEPDAFASEPKTAGAAQA